MLISKYNFVLNCTLKNWKYTIFFRWFLRTCQHHLAYKQKLEFQRGFSINKGLRRYLVKTLTISRRGWCHKRKFTLKLKGYLKLFQFFLLFLIQFFSNLQIFFRDSIFLLTKLLPPNNWSMLNIWLCKKFTLWPQLANFLVVLGKV